MINVSEVSETVLISSPLFFILFCGWDIYHSLFQVTYLFFCLCYLIIDSFWWILIQLLSCSTMSVCSLVLQDLCNLSSIVSICASILFLKSWVIFSIIILNYFSDELLIASSFSHSCKFLSCSFIWNFIVCHFTFSDLLCLCSPFCRLQDFISFYLWSLPLSGWGWLRGFSCYPLDGGGGGRELCLGNRVSVLWMKTVLEVYDGDGNMDVFNSTKLELRLPRWCYW